jgi:hypothetical protein
MSGSVVADLFSRRNKRPSCADRPLSWQDWQREGQDGDRKFSVRQHCRKEHARSLTLNLLRRGLDAISLGPEIGISRLTAHGIKPEIRRDRAARTGYPGTSLLCRTNLINRWAI